MNYLLVVYIPILLIIAWSVRSTYRRGRKFDASMLLGCGVIVVTNALIKHFVFEGYQLPLWLSCLQQILTSLIVPLAYTLFARQAGRTWFNETTILLLALILFLLFPNLVVISDTSKMVDVSQMRNIGFRSFCIVGSNKIIQYTISDFIIGLQAVITMTRVLPAYHKQKRYGLELSKDMKRFLLWWLFAVLFIVFASLNSTLGIAEPVMNSICHVLFMLIVTSIFFLMGRGFDLRPVIVTRKNDVKQTESVELDSFVRQSQDMAQKLRTLIEEKHIHLECGYNADKAIAELGTNRTYFYKMVKAEFRCTFSELLNRERVKNVKNLLETTDDSLMIIAEKSGFSDPSYMIKVFKQETKLTPNEWRERKGNQVVSDTTS